MLIDIAPAKRKFHRGGPDRSDDVRLPRAKDTGCKRADVTSCFECPYTKEKGYVKDDCIVKSWDEEK